MTARARGLGVVLVIAAAIGSAELAAAAPRPSVEAAWDWRFVTGGRVRYPPAVSQDGVIYCVSDDRWLHAVDTRGREIWRAALAARPLGSPVVADDGSILLETSDRAVSRLGAQGRLRWRRVLDRPAVSELALDAQGGLYVPLSDGYLAALDFSGRTRWTYRFNTQIAAAPSVGREGQVYVSTGDRSLHALSSGGEELWSAVLPAVGGSAAIGTDGTVYVSAFGIHAYTADGRPRWDFPVSVPTTDPVIALGEGGDTDVVVFGGRDGRIHRIGGDGQRLEEIELGGEILTPPALRADTAIVVSTSGGVSRVYPGRPGEPVARVRLGSAYGRATLAPGGMAFVGSEDWLLTAFGFGDSPASESPAGPWPQPRADGRNAGRAAMRGPSSSYLILSEMVSAPLLSGKEGVLEDIRRHLSGERYLPLTVTQIEDLLIRLAQEGSVSRVYVGEGASADYPMVRSLACALLGDLGTMAARAALLVVVDRDPRREVQSSAASALGRVGYDPDGSSGRGLGRLAARYRADTGVLAAVVRALREVAAGAGPGVGLGDAGGGGEEGLRPAWAALVSIAVGAYPESAKAAARGALRELAAGRSG